MQREGFFSMNHLIIYSDYACPFVHNVAVWLDNLKTNDGLEVFVDWKPFMLDQVKTQNETGSDIWNVSDITKPRSLLAQIAGLASKRQGVEVFQAFHLQLLKAKHGSGKVFKLNDLSNILRVARKVGLDIDRLELDINDEDIRMEIAKEHTNAVMNHGVFGTPTIISDGKNAGYLKIFVPPVEKSLEFYKNFISLNSAAPFLGELKRPQPPWPVGLKSQNNN